MQLMNQDTKYQKKKITIFLKDLPIWQLPGRVGPHDLMIDWNRKLKTKRKMTTFNFRKNLEEKCAEDPGDGHENRYKGADLDVGKHPGQ